MDGLLRVHKPIGPTSTDVVRAAKKVFKTRQVGHLGTLDPAASGLLLLGVGEGAKVAQYLDLDQKFYEFDIVLGAQTNTDDDDGEVTETSDKTVSMTKVAIELSKWLGHVMQVPPQFSAIKIDGVRSYKKARQGVEVALKPREVRIDYIRLERFEDGVASVAVGCGGGTYMRSIARDVGAALGTFGHARNIHRTQIGAFSIDGAPAMDDMSTMDLVPMHEMVVPLNHQTITTDEAARFRQGQYLLTGYSEQDLPVAVFCEGEFIAMGLIEWHNRWLLRPKRVFKR